MASPRSEEADWSIARKGISLLLNNRIEEAENLFNQHPRSFHIQAGRSFVLFMNALMTFEDDKLQQAVQLLRDMERECADDIGWLKSVRSRVFGAEVSDSEYVRKLDRQVVLADSQVCAALLTLLQQELTGYVRGGWMLRKAWRVYQHTYNQILQLYRRTFGNSPSGLHSMCGTPASENGHTPGSLLQSPTSPTSDCWSIPSANGSVHGSFSAASSTSSTAAPTPTPSVSSSRQRSPG